MSEITIKTDTRKEKRRSRAYRLREGLSFKIVSYVFLALFCVWVLLPFYVIVITSLTSITELMSSIRFIWFPKEGISFEGYNTVLFDDMLAVGGMSSLLRGFLNTMWMTVPSLFVNLFVSGLAAYSYAKLNFKAKNTLYMITIATMMIPSAVMTMPSYLFYDAIGWSQGPLPIIIPTMFGSAGTVFFLKQFFSGIPTDLIDAGKIDGMGYFSMYIKIMLPLSVPAFLAQGILGFVGGYNNYLGPLLYLNGRVEMYTLQLSLSVLQGIYGSDQSVQCASAVIAILPLLVIYLVCQKFFIQGVAATGLKD